MAGEKGSTAILRFRLAALEKAESLAKSIKVTVQQSADLAKDAKERLTRALKERLDDVRDLKKNVEKSIRLQQRADAIRNTQRAGVSEFSPITNFGDTFKGLAGKSFGAFKRDVNDVLQPLRDAANGDVTSAIEGAVGQAGGPLGKIAAFLTKQLREYVDQRIAIETRLRSEELKADLEAQRYAADYQRRLQEEPAFARKEAARAWDLTKREEAALDAQGFTGQSDLLERF